MRSGLRASGLAAVTGVTMALGGAAGALETGSYGVWLQTAQGNEKIRIADLAMAEDGLYSVDMDHSQFSEHFLSMRPFRCLDGPEKLWCHVPYPYAINRNISNDLIDIEYDFLFIWKKAGSYGIDLWNGVYYVVKTDGPSLVGVMHEMDMNSLSVPPEDGVLRPVNRSLLDPAEPENHWLPTLLVLPE